MSVLVRDMAMPSECEYCGFCRYYPQNGNVWCNAKNKLLKERWTNPKWTYLDVKKPEWCPLVEVPTPHGRLIDADEIRWVDSYENGVKRKYKVAFSDEMPDTVIEAEVEE